MTSFKSEVWKCERSSLLLSSGSAQFGGCGQFKEVLVSVRWF